MISLKLFEELYKKVDYSALGNKDVLFEEASGVKYVNMVVEKYFDHISDEYFFEYSTIASTINIYRKELYCFSAIKGSEYFKKRLYKYAQPVIKEVFNDVKGNWFHNPQLFIAPSINSVRPFVNKKNTTYPDLLKIGVDVDKIVRKIDNDTIEESHATKSSDGRLYILDLRYDRSFELMLESSKSIYKKCGGDETSLTASYHNGAELLRACYDKILDIKDEENYYYLTFPIISARNSQASELYSSLYSKEEMTDRVQGTGHFFIYFKVGNNITEDELKTKIDSLYCEMNLVLNFLSLNYIFNSALDLYTQSRKEAIKAAKAAIMSRNMSHNLGSHVMFYIKQKLESVSKIVEGDVLKNIIPGCISSIDDVLEKVKDNKDVELPFLVGLGKFINYLQERQDYIATIATDYIPANSTISFKDFVYDELKPDLRYKRHHKGANPDANGSEPGNLLLDYIAFSEGYTSSDMIELKFGEFNGEDPSDGTRAYDDFETLRKFNVAVPGGVVGRQAIFSIIENIIRNAAKHCSRRRDGKLSIHFALLDENSLSARLIRDSNCELRCKRSETSEIESGTQLIEKYEAYINDYHILSIKLDMPNDKNSIDELVEKLGEDYVGSDGLMKDSSKGLKEMRISAAWLRGCSIDTLIDTKEPPVLSVLSEPMAIGSDKYTLTYILCIPKPRKIAFVVDDDVQDRYDQLRDWIKSYGCEIFKVSERLTANCKIPNYDLVCLCTDKNREVIMSKISSRYIDDKNIALAQLNALNNIDNSDELSEKLDSIYTIWFNEWHNKNFPQSCDVSDKKHRLAILDAKARDNRKKQSEQFNDKFGVLKNGLIVSMSTGEAKASDCENAVVYSTHFKGLKNNSDESKFVNAVSIESVSGNNSTDRLIRRDEWTKEWMCKHLSAGLSKVAIFDERIFSTFVQSNGVDEDAINSCLDEFYNKPESKRNKTEFIKKIQNMLKIDNLGDAADMVNTAISDRDMLKKEIANRSPRTYNIDVAQINHEKRIWAYDIRCFANSEPPRVDFVGYTAPIYDKVGAHSEASTFSEKIASITKEGDRYIVEIIASQVFEGQNGQVFDYISIHQGVLDKIYTTFGVKSNSDEMFKITNALHKAFSKHPTPENCKKFLPNFIIHSGRSKPNLADMPQPQPFVQFAAIDQAVKDCKYTLVELLATAHYEDNNNN